MQPPPRQVKESQQAKLGFSELLSRLQNKQQQNTELQEEIRSFGKQRAAIEREYGQALQRLAVQHQKKDWLRGSTDGISTGVFAVWRLVVDATAHSAASRLAAAEEYQQLIGRASRSLRSAKDVRTKRGLEQLQKVQGEVVEALRDLQQVKKSYHQVAHMAHVAREKAADAQTRVKRSEHGIFHFKAGLHKLANKLCAKMTECDEHLTEVRNDYLLALAAVNAHHRHYLSHDLPHILEQMEGDVYEDFKSHFMLLCATEMDTCMAIHKQYSSVWESVSKVTRERNVLQFLQESAPFRKTPQFIFQQAPHDKVCTLQEVCRSKSEEEFLLNEAKKWATKAAKDYKVICNGQRVLQILESRLKLLSGETGVSMEQKIAEMQDTVRKAKLSRVKAEGRLALLSAAVAGVEQLIHEAMTQVEGELEMERRLSEHRRSTEVFSEDEFDLTDFEDYDDSNKEVFEPVASSEGCVYPIMCKVIYSYQAGQSDELSVVEGEDLQVVEDGDMEDWLKGHGGQLKPSWDRLQLTRVTLKRNERVCNACGQVGYVPENYVQFLCTQQEGARQPDSIISMTPPNGIEAGTSSRGVARALYSYQAQSAEELSFQQGALIRLISCQHGEVDDGFWEGELHGRTGVFPSLVVELIHVDGEEQDQEVRLHGSPVTAQTTTSISHQNPTTFNPGYGSEISATPSCGLEDKQQDYSTQTMDQKTVTPDTSHNPPDQSQTRLRPCRPPPSPPTQNSSYLLEEE